jgi:hypothetical protein
MEYYDSDVIFMHGEAAEIRYGYLTRLNQVPMAKAPPRPTKCATLVYKHYIEPEVYIRPIVVMPGKHYSDIPNQNVVRGWRTKERYMICTMLISERDRGSEWFKAGIADVRGRIWFVDP